MLEHMSSPFARFNSARLLAPRSIFVFGSNLAGRHGKGAALHARKVHGAVYGVGEGPTGNAYALPTKGRRLEVLPIEQIREHVRAFIAYAERNPGLNFEVTKVACGLAGYAEPEIAPLFSGAPMNCFLPVGWRSLAKSTAPAPVDVLVRRNPFLKHSSSAHAT